MKVCGAKKLQVLIAAPHRLCRLGLKCLLRELKVTRNPDEAATPADVLCFLQNRDPSLVLIDRSMAVRNGFHFTRSLAKEYPEARFVIVANDVNGNSVREAFKAGALGFYWTSDSTAELNRVLQAAAAGRRAISSGVRRFEKSHSTAAQRAKPQLTPRQCEVLRLMAEGRHTKEIASILQVSPKTVEFHRARLMTRLGINTLPELVRFAMRQGFVPPELT